MTIRYHFYVAMSGATAKKKIRNHQGGALPLTHRICTSTFKQLLVLGFTGQEDGGVGRTLERTFTVKSPFFTTNSQ